MTNGYTKPDSDFEEEIIVTRQEEERDPDAEADFDRELAKMMAESLDSRKFERKPMFDVPLPMRRAARDASTAGEDSPNEGIATPPNTMAFYLMTKKGNRQQVCSFRVVTNDTNLISMSQTRTIEMPSDSQFAVAMKNQKEAERVEQQRIKNLVLNYDLQDSSTDQTGTGSNLYLNYFSQPNPNIPFHTSMITRTHNALSEGLAGAPEKHGASHHQHNASLHQSSSAALNNASLRPAADKSSANRSGQRARKLQLSDVDWYGPGQKPGSSRSRDPPRGERRTAG